MIDFTQIQIENVQDAIIDLRKSKKITYKKLGESLGVGRSRAKIREQNISVCSTSGFLKHLKTLGASLYFDPDQDKKKFVQSIPFIEHLLDNYKKGKIDANTVGRKIIQKLS